MVRRARRRRCRSRATTSPRSSSPRAPPPSRRASSSPIATCWRTSCRSNARCSSTGSGARPFFPLRFLNLLPLSHMFGQAMATFIPPMLPGVVVFMRGYNPGEIVAQIKKRRISVLVSVPKILDVLREHVLRARRRKPATPRTASSTSVQALVALPPRPPSVRAQVLGVRRRRGAARRRARGVLGRARVRGDPGIRPHRDRADRHAQSSVRDQARLGREGHRRRRDEDCAGRRDSGARRERHDRAISTPPRKPRERSRTAGSTPATSARSAPTASSSSAAARRK